MGTWQISVGYHVFLLFTSISMYRSISSATSIVSHFHSPSTWPTLQRRDSGELVVAPLDGKTPTQAITMTSMKRFDGEKAGEIDPVS